MQRLKQSLSSLPTPSIPSFSSSPGDKATPPPLDPELLASLSARRELASNVQATFGLLVHHLSKQRPSPVSGRGNATDLAVKWFGDELVKGADELQDSRAGADEAYSYSLRHVGELSQQHAQLATAYHDQLGMGFLEPVEARAAEYKDLFKNVKEAEKKRSTLESVMAKMEKGKKDPAEFEREFDQAEWAYQDDCSRLRRRAEQLESTLQDDVDALRQLVEVQLDYARSYVSLLEECQSALDSAPSASSRPRTSPAHQLSASSTRMARSQSESSIHGPPAATSSAAIFSILGPNRSRRSTVSSQTGADKEKSGADKDAKNRSRSGSMLERFALGNKNKKRGGEGDDETAPSPEGAASSAPTSGASTPSRFAPSMPSLPTLGSFKKLSLQSSPGKYGTLADAHHEPTSSPTSSFSSSTASASASARRLPPALKRTQTAPAASPSPSSPSRARPPPPLPSRTTAAGPVGQTYRAQWAYKPAATVPDDEDDEEEGAGELELEKGDVVRVEKEVNADWWIGVGVQGAAQGRRGMFPSAYVVPHTLEAHSDDEDDEDEIGRGAQWRWTTFGNASTSFSASSDGHDASVGRPSFDGDALTDTDDGEHGLLDNGAQDRTASPFGDPRERRARQRGETVTASPFDDDRVSYAHARGESSR